MLFERSKCVISDIETYFFSAFLQNIIKDKQFVQNEVLGFIVGHNTAHPSNEQIVNAISMADIAGGGIHTVLDCLYMLGPNYISELRALGKKLPQSGGSHYIIDILNCSKSLEMFEKNVAAYCRKMMIQKEKDAKIISAMYKVASAKSPMDQFNACIDLCSLNLEWDALVFIKLLGLENEDTAEEVDAIWNDILMKLEKNHESLVRMIREGPKADKEEVVLELLRKPNAQGVADAILLLIEDWKLYSDEEDIENAFGRAEIALKINNIILHTIVANHPMEIGNFDEILPKGISEYMFHGLQKFVYRSSVCLLYNVVRMFISEFTEDQEIENLNWENSLISEDLMTEWKRNALVQLLWNFHAAAVRPVFNNSFNSTLEKKIGNFNQLVGNAVRFAIWIVSYFGKETSDEAIYDVGRFGEQKMIHCSAFLKKYACASSEITREHIRRMCEALEVSNSNGFSNEIITNEEEYSSEAVKKISLSLGETLNKRIPDPIDESDSANILEERSRDIGSGVIVKALDPDTQVKNVTCKPVQNTFDKPFSLYNGISEMKVSACDVENRNITPPEPQEKEKFPIESTKNYNPQCGDGFGQGDILQPTMKFASSGFQGAKMSKGFGTHPSSGFGIQEGRSGGHQNSGSGFRGAGMSGDSQRGTRMGGFGGRGRGY